MSMVLYEPHEDSTLLANIVRAHARGGVLDVGTGTGIQAFAALEHPDVSSVLAVDINPEAIAFVQTKIEQLPSTQQARISVRRSDLFRELSNMQFDTIVCNPPYLPDDPDVQDVALDGGPGGFEWIERMLADARAHLAPGGQVLFLFSSLSNKERIDAALKRLGYSYAQLAQQAHFFEQLFVYRAWVMTCV